MNAIAAMDMLQSTALLLNCYLRQCDGVLLKFKNSKKLI